MILIKSMLKIAALWLVLLFAMVAGGGIAEVVLHPAPSKLIPDGPFGLMQALALMTTAYAVALALYAARLRGGFFSRTAAVFAILYEVGSALSVIETIYFNAYVKLPVSLLEETALAGLIQAAITAPVAAALWRSPPGEAETISGLWWRLALIVPLYIAFYFGAGQFIAFQGAELRAYYDQSAHIDRLQVALLQVGRGLIWAGLTWMSVRSLGGSRPGRALVIGVVFAVIMVMPLVIPNPYMPWAVRKMHFLEIATSNLLFGIMAAGLLLSGMKAQPATGRT